MKYLIKSVCNFAKIELIGIFAWFVYYYFEEHLYFQ